MKTEKYRNIELQKIMQHEKQMKFNFWERNSEYRKTGDIPPEYVEVAKVVSDSSNIENIENIENITKYVLLCKKVDDKYFYLIGNKNISEWSSKYVHYYDEHFLDKIKDNSNTFIDVTKDDFSCYKESEKVGNCYYFQSYLTWLKIKD